MPVQQMPDQWWFEAVMNTTPTDYVFKGVVVVLLVWALTGYVRERTKKRKAGEQVLTADEVKKVIEDAIENQGKICTGKMSAYADVVQAKLDHGEKQFEQDRRVIEGLREAVGRLSEGVAVLNATIERNGIRGS